MGEDRSEVRRTQQSSRRESSLPARVAWRGVAERYTSASTGNRLYNDCKTLHRLDSAIYTLFLTDGCGVDAVTELSAANSDVEKRSDTSTNGNRLTKAAIIRAHLDE